MAEPDGAHGHESEMVHKLHPDGTEEVVGGAGYTLPEPPAPPDEEHGESEDVTDVITAFMIVQLPDGTWMSTNDVNQPIRLQREAGPVDMHVGCIQISEDIKMRWYAQQVVAAQMGMAQQLAQQAEAQQIVEQMARDPK